MIYYYVSHGGNTLLRIHEHALKHGLNDRQIAHAWSNLVRSRRRHGADDPEVWIGIGILPDGNLAELVAFLDAEGIWCVFHAMMPPTAKVLNELGLRGDSNGSHQSR